MKKDCFYRCFGIFRLSAESGNFLRGERKKKMVDAGRYFLD
jgi:hypothetical protein